MWTARTSGAAAVITGSVLTGVREPARREDRGDRGAQLHEMTPLDRRRAHDERGIGLRERQRLTSPQRVDRRAQLRDVGSTDDALARGQRGAEKTRPNLAVTARAWSRTTVQEPEPVQAPDQPTNVAPARGAAVRVTEVPAAKLAAQTVLQARPPGVLVTVPVPAPPTVTVSATVVVVKVAVTVVALTGVTVQVPVPVQPPPDQPAKTEPVAGAAVRTTGLPARNVAEQVVPHAMPAGALVTLPLPRPARTTVSATGAGAKVARTVVAVMSVRAQLPVPAHPPPDQPAKTHPDAGAAVRMTPVPPV